MISSFFSAFDQFRTMTPIDVVDILVVAYIIYRVMKLLKDTSAARLAKGILILVLIMLFASFLHLTMISWLLRNALSVGVFAVVVIFQPELRRLLEQIGISVTLKCSGPSATTITSLPKRSSTAPTRWLAKRSRTVCSSPLNMLNTF